MVTYGCALSASTRFWTDHEATNSPSTITIGIAV